MSGLIILIIVLAGIALYIWSLYNQFVTIKIRIKASIQEIGNQLKRQADLIPNLVNSVKGYMKHEKEIFTQLTEARKAVMRVVDSGDAQKLIEAGTQLQAALAPIRAVFESTPQLQAAGPTSKLMDELRDTADKVMYSRRTLIDLSADYNVMIVTFPSNLIARIFGFTPEVGLKVPEGLGGKEGIEVKTEELKTPRVDL